MKTPTLIRIFFILSLTAIWLTACDGGSSLSADITRGESKWNTQEIQNYIIEVAQSSGTWHYQTQKITVMNGEVVRTSDSCIDAPMETALGQECQVQAYNPEDYTVPGLFKLAWAYFENFPTKNLEIEFDPDYGYPAAIRYDDPDIVDDDQALAVISFQVLAEGEEPLNTEINQAESKWQAQGVLNYVIKVAHASGTWHYQVHTITVQNGEVVESSAECTTAPMETALEKDCEVLAYNPQDYTVPGLFRMALSKVRNSPAGSIEIEFNPQFGYPTVIRFDDPDLIDEEEAWSVKSFEILEE